MKPKAKREVKVMAAIVLMWLFVIVAVFAAVGDGMDRL